MQAFSKRRREKKLRRILHDESGGGAQDMSIEFFAQNIEDVTCLCSTLSRIWRKWLDPKPKPSNLKENNVSY